MLLGFMRLNNVHNGKRLGGALFKTVKWLRIAHKVFQIITQNYRFLTSLHRSVCDM